MRKPQLFRDAIAAVFPEYDSQARDKLAVYVENGRIRARPSLGGAAAVAGFEWSYTLQIVLLDFKGDANQVMAAALEWLADHQPALLQRHEGAAIDLQADIIDDERIDLQLSLELSETVRRTEDGFEYLPEPGLDLLFGDTAPATLSRVDLNDGMTLP